MSIDYTRDYYAILGIAPSASPQDIKTSYHTAARRFHPDTNSNPGAAVQFQEMVAAHEILSDETKRDEYDRLRGRLVADPTYLNVQVIPSRRTLPVLGEAQVMYVLIQVTANPEFRAAERRSTPLNLVLVLDRSKSMRGPRLDRVKVAAHQIIDQLGAEDYLSIVTFSDRADAIIKNEAVTDRTSLKAVINTMTADGGTEIFQGLSEGMNLVKRRYSENAVNHIILLTDGETYDDHALSLALADEALSKGVGISTMGIGEEWNDVFLDNIASKTGGYCAYINSPGAVVKFLNDRVRSLGSAFAERLSVSIAPDADIKLESVFKLMPNPQPIDGNIQPIPLGVLEYTRSVTVLAQLQMPKDLTPAFRSLVRVDVTGDILHQKRQGYKVLTDLSIEISEKPAPEDPPRPILDALGKLTLYRMQQKAEAAIHAGNFDEATRRLENLATRLLEIGQNELAATARLEAQRIQQTRSFSQGGQKTMKFGTRLLLLSDGDNAEGEVPA